jgi:dienelactone hydrolase
VTGGYPVWFGDERRPAFGWFHGRERGESRGGVVVCPSLGQEYMQSHYALRVVSEDLAAQGFSVLRVDYDATGDSAGTGEEEHRVEAWLETVQLAVSLLRKLGLTEVALLGMRLGATLAAEVASRDRAIDQLVLWDPCASGRAFLSEQRIVSSASFGASSGLPEGSVEAAGVVYNARTVAEMRKLNMERCALPLARRVFVLTRPDRPASWFLSQQSLASEEVTWEAALGQSELLENPPPTHELPRRAMARIIHWMSKGANPTPQRAASPPIASRAIVASDPSGRPIIESPVSIPPLGLFGIVTEPAESAALEHAPTAIFVSVSKQHHVGSPVRLWVELAREWAGAGIRSLRMDLSGLGDSPARSIGREHWLCHKADAFEDVTDACRYMSPSDPSDVVLVGLCSSGYQVLESALRIRPRGVVAVNPIVSFVPAEHRLGLPLDGRRQLLFPRDTAAGQLFQAGGRWSSVPQRWPGLAWRARLARSPERRSARWLTTLVSQGTDTLILCGDREMRPIRLGVSRIRLRRLRESGNLRLEHFPGLQHELLKADQRHAVKESVSDYVLSRFATRAQTVPGSSSCESSPVLGSIAAASCPPLGRPSTRHAVGT